MSFVPFLGRTENNLNYFWNLLTLKYNSTTLTYFLFILSATSIKDCGTYTFFVKKEMSSKFSLMSDLLAMNVSWYPHELELYTNRSSVTMSTIFTIILIITFLMGVIVQKAIFKLLNRLPQRAINQIIYPYMVKKSDRHTVFPRIVPAETILFFWSWSAAIIQGRKLFNGGN